MKLHAIEKMATSRCYLFAIIIGILNWPGGNHGAPWSEVLGAEIVIGKIRRLCASSNCTIGIETEYHVLYEASW